MQLIVYVLCQLNFRILVVAVAVATRVFLLSFLLYAWIQIGKRDGHRKKGKEQTEKQDNCDQ